MSARRPKITAESVILLRDVCESKAPNYAPQELEMIAPNAPLPRHVQALMQYGYLVRVGIDMVHATPNGRAFLAGIDWADQRDEEAELDRRERVARGLVG